MGQPMGWCCWEEMGSCCWIGERQPAVSTQKEKGPAVERSLETKLARTLETLEDGATEGKRRERERWGSESKQARASLFKGQAGFGGGASAPCGGAQIRHAPTQKQQHRPTNDGQHRQGGRTRRRCEGQAEIIIQGETGKGALKKEKEKSRNLRRRCSVT